MQDEGPPRTRKGRPEEIRVLNQIARITADGLRYEADPRHAELLATSLMLETCKSMVTPGIKLPFDDNSGPDEDDVDKEEDTQMVNKIATKERLRPIRFNLDADIVNVPMQSASEKLCLRQVWSQVATWP